MMYSGNGYIGGGGIGNQAGMGAPPPGNPYFALARNPNAQAQENQAAAAQQPNAGGPTGPIPGATMTSSPYGVHNMQDMAGAGVPGETNPTEQSEEERMKQILDNAGITNTQAGPAGGRVPSPYGNSMQVGNMGSFHNKFVS